MPQFQSKLVPARGAGISKASGLSNSTEHSANNQNASILAGLKSMMYFLFCPHGEAIDREALFYMILDHVYK